MKLIFILLTISLLVIFGLSIDNSITSFANNATNAIINDTTIVAFDPVISENPEVKELEKKFSVLIIKEKKSINTNSKFAIGLNLLITIITGLCALMTTISTIKNTTVTKSIAILIAVITFISSLLSYMQSQVNTFKDDSENRKKKIIEIREQFHSLKNDEVNNQLQYFNSKLDEEL